MDMEHSLEKSWGGIWGLFRFWIMRARVTDEETSWALSHREWEWKPCLNPGILIAKQQVPNVLSLRGLSLNLIRNLLPQESHDVKLAPHILFWPITEGIFFSIKNQPWENTQKEMYFPQYSKCCSKGARVVVPFVKGDALISFVLWRQRQAVPWGSPTESVSSRSHWVTVSSNTSRGFLRDNTQVCALTSARTHTHTHTNTWAHTYRCQQHNWQ